MNELIWEIHLMKKNRSIYFINFWINIYFSYVDNKKYNMPSFPAFNIQLENIYKKFINNKFNKKILKNRKYKMYYHMHPNPRLKKMLIIFANPILQNGPDASVPFFVITVNKINKNNKEKFICIYNNLYVGGIKELKLKFTTKEDEKSIEKNIKELQKIVKIIKFAFHNLHKDLRSNVNFYKQ